MLLATSLRAASGLVRPRLPRSAITASALSPARVRRLLSALAVLEQRDGKLNHGSLSAITAAKQLGGSVHGFVAGSGIKPVAEEAAKVEGVEKIIAVENGAYDKVCMTPGSLSPTAKSSPRASPKTWRPSSLRI